MTLLQKLLHPVKHLISKVKPGIFGQGWRESWGGGGVGAWCKWTTGQDKWGLWAETDWAILGPTRLFLSGNADVSIANCILSNCVSMNKVQRHNVFSCYAALCHLIFFG